MIAAGGKAWGRASHSLTLWFLGSRALLAAGFAVSVWTPVEGKIGTNTAAWTPAFKAIRKIGSTGIASAAVAPASIWIAEHPCNLGALGEGCIIRPGVFLAFSALRAGTDPMRRVAEDRTGLDREVAVNEWFLYQAFNAGWVDEIQPSTKFRNALACNNSSSASVAVAIAAPV